VRFKDFIACGSAALARDLDALGQLVEHIRDQNAPGIAVRGREDLVQSAPEAEWHAPSRFDRSLDEGTSAGLAGGRPEIAAARAILDEIEPRSRRCTEASGGTR